jgi:tRNA1(Val) A37 N6-methylase TrmN6
MAAAEHSLDGLLGGRVSYLQPRQGYRTGIEPVLLAAFIPARPGDRVVEAGTGAGAGLLCLATRVAGLHGTGLERDPSMADLATRNLAANGLADIRVLTQDVEVWRSEPVFDHAFANPPWHSQAGTQSALAARRQAKFAGEDLLHRWTGTLAAALRPRGTLSLILPATALAQGVAALLQADCAEMLVFPLWKRAGEAARLVLLRGLRHGGGGCQINAGLVLHGEAGGYTPEARKILWDGEALAA